MAKAVTRAALLLAGLMLAGAGLAAMQALAPWQAAEPPAAAQRGPTNRRNRGSRCPRTSRGTTTTGTRCRLGPLPASGPCACGTTVRSTRRRCPPMASWSRPGPATAGFACGTRPPGRSCGAGRIRGTSGVYDSCPTARHWRAPDLSGGISLFDLQGDRAVRRIEGVGIYVALTSRQTASCWRPGPPIIAWKSGTSPPDGPFIASTWRVKSKLRPCRWPSLRTAGWWPPEDRKALYAFGTSSREAKSAGSRVPGRSGPARGTTRLCRHCLFARQQAVGIRNQYRDDLSLGRGSREGSTSIDRRPMGNAIVPVPPGRQGTARHRSPGRRSAMGCHVGEGSRRSTLPHRISMGHVTITQLSPDGQRAATLNGPTMKCWGPQIR